MKPEMYSNKRGETVVTYQLFKLMKIDAILRAISRR